MRTPDFSRLLAAIDCDHKPQTGKCAGCPYYGGWHNVPVCRTGGIKADVRFAVKTLQKTEAKKTVL